MGVDLELNIESDSGILHEGNLRRELLTDWSGAIPDWFRSFPDWSRSFPDWSRSFPVSCRKFSAVFRMKPETTTLRELLISVDTCKNGL
jgi:hypothetical protein